MPLFIDHDGLIARITFDRPAAERPLRKPLAQRIWELFNQLTWGS